jgi:hypothetical protein
MVQNPLSDELTLAVMTAMHDGLISAAVAGQPWTRHNPYNPEQISDPHMDGGLPRMFIEIGGRTFRVTVDEMGN